jgi:hypothetical protein
MGGIDMGWLHGTFGRSAYDNFVGELKSQGFEVWPKKTPSPNQPRRKRLCRGQDGLSNDLPLRITRFRFPSWDRNIWMIVEEILAVDDRDCNGASIVSLLVYPEGHRPDPPPPVVSEA